MHRSIKKILKLGSIGLLFLVIIIFSYFKTRDLLGGVRISVDSVKDGQTFEEPLITVHGKVRNSFNLTLNDRKIFTDQDGIFSEQILLLAGYNIITLKAEDKFGKKDEEDLRLFYKEPPKDTPAVNISEETTTPPATPSPL